MVDYPTVENEKEAIGTPVSRIYENMIGKDGVLFICSSIYFHLSHQPRLRHSATNPVVVHVGGVTLGAVEESGLARRRANTLAWSGLFSSRRPDDHESKPEFNWSTPNGIAKLKRWREAE